MAELGRGGRRCLEYLREHPGATPNELAKGLKWGLGVVNKSLKTIPGLAMPADENQACNVPQEAFALLDVPEEAAEGEVAQAMGATAERKTVDRITASVAEEAKENIELAIKVGRLVTQTYEEAGRALGCKDPLDMLESALPFWLANRLRISEMEQDNDALHIAIEEIHAQLDPVTRHQKRLEWMTDRIMQGKFLGLTFSSDELGALVRATVYDPLNPPPLPMIGEAPT